MKFAIVEDEKFFMDNLKQTITQTCCSAYEFDITTFYTGEEMVEAYRSERTNYDIIFLDIKLVGIDGIETARRLRKLGYENAVVFTTSHTDFNFIQQSYGVGALQYFEKPIKEENIMFCLEHLAAEKKYEYTYNGKKILIPYKEILYFETNRNYMKICTINPQAIVPPHRTKFSAIFNKLPREFVRCHRSFVVNITHVISLQKTQLIMRNLDNLPIPISKVHIESVYDAFNNL